MLGWSDGRSNHCGSSTHADVCACSGCDPPTELPCTGALALGSGRWNRNRHRASEMDTRLNRLYLQGGMQFIQQARGANLRSHAWLDSIALPWGERTGTETGYDRASTTDRIWGGGGGRTLP
jgi:hypothetical protein